MLAKVKWSNFSLALVAWLTLDSILTWAVVENFPEQFDNGEGIFWVWFISVWLGTLFSIIILRRKKNTWASNGIISAILLNFALWVLFDILGLISMTQHIAYYLISAIMPSPLFVILVLLR